MLWAVSISLLLGQSNTKITALKKSIFLFSIWNIKVDSPFENKRDNSHGLLNSASSNGTNANNKKANKRFQRIYELYETEKRFVTILHTIIHVSFI